MTKSTITRERLEQLADNNTICKVSWDERIELAQIALSAMDCEPVAWAWHYREQWHVTNDERRAEFVAKDGDVAVLPLYRHAQPAQISEPVLPLQDKDLQGVIDSLEHPAGINAAGKQVVRHALVELQERRKADREPVAEVVSIYGDPEAFGEREIRPLVGIQQMPYGTKLYRHAQRPVVPNEITSASAPEVFEVAAEAERLGLRGTYASYAVGCTSCHAAMLAAAQQEVQVVSKKIEQSRKRVNRCDVCTEGARGGCGTCIFNGNFV
ncbi:hypothetical protein ACVYNI_20240 [Escherichia coli]